MKISIVTGFFLPVPPLRGGSTEKIWHRLALLLAGRGHEVTFVSRRFPGLPDSEAAGGVRHLRLPGADHSRSLVANLWRDARWGIRVARSLPPADVVICNTVTLPAWLARFKPGAGRVVAVLARMPKGHGRAYGRVDLLLALSAAVAARLQAENATLARRVAVFPYPIDCDLHARCPRPSRGTVTIGYVGRLHPAKGVGTLLAAAARLAEDRDLPPWQLRLAGPWAVAEGGGGEPFRADLEARLRAALGDRWQLSGPEFDPARLATTYAGIDVFCYPSVDRGETFGVAVAEAMAARCAPVVSRLECFRDLVRHGETGLTFDHHAASPESALAAALGELLRDGARRETIARRAQEHVRRYDFAAAVLDLEVRLQALVASGGDRSIPGGHPLPG